MIISQLSGRSAEIIDIEVFAQDGGGSFTQNFPVCLAVDGNTANGIAAIHPTAATGKSFAGIMRGNVAIGSYGNARAWGYNASAICSNYGSSVTITAGDALRPVTGVGLGMSSTVAALTVLNTKYAVALSTTNNTNSVNGAMSSAAQAAAWQPVLVRAI